MAKLKKFRRGGKAPQWEILQDGGDSTAMYNYSQLQKNLEGYHPTPKATGWKASLDNVLQQIVGGNEVHKGWGSESKFEHDKKQSLEFLKDPNLAQKREESTRSIYDKSKKWSITNPDNLDHKFKSDTLSFEHVMDINKKLWHVADSLVTNNPNIAYTNPYNSPDIQHRTIEPNGGYWGMAGNQEFPKPSTYKDPVVPYKGDSTNLPQEKKAKIVIKPKEVVQPAQPVTPKKELNQFYKPDGTVITDSATIARLKNLPSQKTGRVYDKNKYELKHQQGGIVDPRGQWAHPGKITIIPSNNITMEGVDYPVLGVSDTGHTQMMQPGGKYKFKGKSVTEYPMMQNGGTPYEQYLQKYSKRPDTDTLYQTVNIQPHPFLVPQEEQRLGELNNARQNTLKILTPQQRQLRIEGDSIKNPKINQWLYQQEHGSEDPIQMPFLPPNYPVNEMQVGGITNKPIQGTREQAKAYQDSLDLYKATIGRNTPIFPLSEQTRRAYQNDRIVPIGEGHDAPIGLGNSIFYKKPVQPIIYQPNLQQIAQNPNPSRVTPSTTQTYQGLQQLRPKEQPIQMDRMEKTSIHTDCPECTAWSNLLRDNNWNPSDAQMEEYNKAFPHKDPVQKVSNASFKPTIGNKIFSRIVKGDEKGKQYDSKGAEIPQFEYFDGKTGKKLQYGGEAPYQKLSNGPLSIGDRKIINTQRKIAKNSKFTTSPDDPTDIPNAIDKQIDWEIMDENHAFQMYGSPEDYYKKFPNEGTYEMFQSKWRNSDLGVSKPFTTWDEVMMQNGGLFNTNKTAYVDSVLDANKNLDFVKRLHDNSMGSIPTPKNVPNWNPNQKSTHLMSYDPGSNRVYPEVVNRNNKLEYLQGDDAWNYADTTKEYIQFPNTQEAQWFADNGYKQGTNVLKNINSKGIPVKKQFGGFTDPRQDSRYTPSSSDRQVLLNLKTNSEIKERVNNQKQADYEQQQRISKFIKKGDFNKTNNSLKGTIAPENNSSFYQDNSSSPYNPVYSPYFTPNFGNQKDPNTFEAQKSIGETNALDWAGNALSVAPISKSLKTVTNNIGADFNRLRYRPGTVKGDYLRVFGTSEFPDNINSIQTISQYTAGPRELFNEYKSGYNTLAKAVDTKVEELISEEGNKRLVNQEKEYLKSIGFDESKIAGQAELNAQHRIAELQNATLLNESIINKFPDNGKGATWRQIQDQSDLVGNRVFNAHNRSVSSSDDLHQISGVSETGFDFTKNSYIGGKYYPGELALGFGYGKNSGTAYHEINHALQKNRRLVIDSDLKSIIPKKDMDIYNAENYRYFRRGSKGQESSSFLAEAREAMKNEGIIKNTYDEVTPEIARKAYEHFAKNPQLTHYPSLEGANKFASNTRIFEFMEPTTDNFKILSKSFNKLPALVPPALGVSAVSNYNNKKSFGGNIEISKQRWEILPQMQLGGMNRIYSAPTTETEMNESIPNSKFKLGGDIWEVID